MRVYAVELAGPTYAGNYAVDSIEGGEDTCICDEFCPRSSLSLLHKSNAFLRTPNDCLFQAISAKRKISAVSGMFIHRLIWLQSVTELIRQALVKSGDEYIIRIPGNWVGGKDANADIVVDDVCIVVPESISNATGELLVLRLLEGMIDAGIISADDVQKAVEHIV